MQAVSPRSFGLRRVPPAALAPAEPELPLLAALQARLGIWRDTLSEYRDTLREHRNDLDVWIAVIAVKYPRVFSFCFSLPYLLALDPASLGRVAARTVTRGLSLLRKTRSLFARIEWKPRYRRLEPEFQPLPPAETISGALVRVLAYVGGIAVISIIAAELLRTAPVVAASHNDVTAPIRADWITVDKPFPAFHLGLPGFAEEGHYTIRRHADGGGRKDIMAWGEPGLSLRYVMMEIYRPGSEFTGFGDVVHEIGVRSPELGPMVAPRASLPLRSKFGPAATVDFAIGRFGGGHCVGFMRTSEEPRLQITGLSCNMDLLVDREAITCALDRLTLMSAGSHPDVARLFAHAELKRSFCGQREPLMYATPKRPGDTGNISNLNLRGRAAAR